MHPLVKQIQKEYPQERVCDSMDAHRNAWLRQRGGRIPFQFAGSALGNWDADEFTSMWYLHLNKSEDLLDYELRRILSRAPLQDDFIPLLSVHGRDGDISTTFPGVYEVLNNDVFWMRTRIKDLRTIPSLEKPDFTRSPSIRRVLDCIQFFVKETGGSIPINASSIPGPAVMAGHLIGVESLMTAFFEYPAEVRQLIDLCTDCIIELYRLELEAAGGLLSPMSNMWFWMPQEAGIFLNEDTIQLLSPKIIESFFAPAYLRIAKSFGGMVIHSCGYWKAAQRTVVRSCGATGIQAGLNETPIKDQLEAIAGYEDRVVLNIHTCSGYATDLQGNPYPAPTARELVNTLLPELSQRGIFTCTIAPIDDLYVNIANTLAREARQIRVV